MQLLDGGQPARRVKRSRLMSARAASPSPSATLRTPIAAMLFAAGFPALVAVLLGGATLGFFGWYAFIARVHRGFFVTESAFIVAIFAGCALAVAAWNGYGDYLSRRTTLSKPAAMRWDAFSWLALALFWLTFLEPLGTSATGRSIALGIGAFALVKLLIAARYNQTVREVAITFTVTRVAIIVIAELAAVVIAQRPGEHVAASANPALAVWGRWDAVHYLDIATKGYFGTDMAFFPLYPLLVRILGQLTGNHLIAGMLISNIALFFGLLYFYKLVEHQYNRPVAQRAIFYISIFPTAIFFSAVYTEALFFALTVASFYYIRERKWLLAGVFGYFAALARVEGILLVAPFAIEWLLSLRQTWRVALTRPVQEFLKPVLAAALIPAGLATYMAYLWVLRGDPLYFSHVQIHWGRHFAPPWQSIVHSIAIMSDSALYSTPARVNQAIEFVFTMLMIAVLILGIRRLRLSYWVYMLLSILVPMSTSSLMSMPRFALVLFPMFVVFALAGQNRAFNNAYVAFSLPMLGLFTVLFADWYWVA